MANMNIGTPRFYTDQISYLMSRGVAQDGNFDVTATHAGNTFMGTFTTGSEPELFDMRPLNKCTFDTSADTDGHVLITIDTQSTSKKSYIAILNHNLVSAVGKIRIFAGDAASDVTAIDGANADTADITWANDTLVEVVNADTTTAATNDKSVVIEPATDGSTIVRFAEQTNRYWGIQFEGNTTNTGVAVNGTWGSTDMFVGCIMIGEYYDMPHSPDLDITRMISYNRMNDLQESNGGQRFSNLKTYGRTAGSTSKSPFTTASTGHDSHGGRIIYDMKFSFINNTDIMPDEYDIIADDDNFVNDVWNMTSGNHLPFIFSIDKSSEGDNAESEHIFGRFANNSLDMQQVAPEIYNLSLTVEEEF
jgi:hypothetical protein